MLKDEAIELMKSATCVDDWNQKREIVKSSIMLAEYQSTLAEIDGSGLIVQVLGQDVPSHRNSN